MYKALLTFFAMTLLTTAAVAQTPNLDSINESDLEDVVHDFSAVFSHSPLSSAAPLGSVFGIEAALVGGLVSTPNLERLTKENDPTSDFDQVPYLSLVGQVSLPFGITGEISFLPEVDAEDFTFKTMGLAAKWTLTETLLAGFPIDLAIRVHGTQSDLSYSQIINNASTSGAVTSTIEYSNTIYGAQLVLSKNLLVVEPYVGVGFLNASGELGVNGEGSIFDTSYTTASQADADVSGLEYFGGMEVNLLLIRGVVQYSRVFDADKIALKLAFGF
ncbi:MAG: hypothetical protein CL675_12950 [Bdellovibrionaceae bacterium]|nr:hypothetical protein [Pseudobdellovibrionaceae bacterium]